MADRTRNRILHALKARGAQTAAEMGVHLGVTSVAVRQHLDGLLADGLVTFEDVRAGVGRPRRIWALSEAGHGRFPDNSSGLILEMIESFRILHGDAALDSLIDHRQDTIRKSYEAAMASESSLADRLAKLAELRSVEGYMAEIDRDETGEWLLIENHCSICAAATACQGFCRAELETFQSVLGPAVTVERLEHRIAGDRRCVYRVSERAS